MYSRMQQSAAPSVDNIIIDNHLLGKTNEMYERYVFNTRKQKANETVDDYIAILCILASTCNFCDCLKDSLLRDRIILGIKDSCTRKRLLQEADLNLETCIAMCRAAEDTSPSQPVKAVTWTEDTTAVQAGSVSSGVQRLGKKQHFFLNFRHCNQIQMASPDDEVEMSEVNFKTELDDSDDSALQWTTEHQSSGFLIDNDRKERNESVCQHCSAAFVLVSSLELHLASVHGEKLHMVLPGSFTHDRCDAGNCSNTDIDKEINSHGNGKMTTNKVDDNAAANEDGLNRCKKHVCDICTRSFPTHSKLKKHKLIHSGVKTFACDVCRKNFFRAGDLKKHTRIHSGERPYKCPHCDSGFNQSSALYVHIKSVHEGHRPHVCDVCGAAFSQTGHLTVHKKIHTGEKPHVCSDCGTGFTKSSDLSRHRLIHTGEKPHSCPHCPSAFRRSHDLKRHVQSKHQ